MDDHRASAGYRAAMLGSSLLKLYADTEIARASTGMTACHDGRDR